METNDIESQRVKYLSSDQGCGPNSDIDIVLLNIDTLLQSYAPVSKSGFPTYVQHSGGPPIFYQQSPGAISTHFFCFKNKPD